MEETPLLGGRRQVSRMLVAWLLALLTVLLPPLAVGIELGWDMYLIPTTVLTLLGWLPGAFYAWSILRMYNAYDDIRRNRVKLS